MMKAPFFIYCIGIVGGFLIAGCGSRVRYPKGGYAYAEHLAENDTEFYFVPLRNKESRRDSFKDAGSFAFWRSIDEPNLSLRPMETDVFRFVYGEALNTTMYIIRLTPTDMTVRVGSATDFYPYRPDTNVVNPLDRRLVRILDRYYPIDDTNVNRSPRRRHFLDSMGRLYPQLYSPGYYKSILKEEYSQAKPWYRFSSRTIALKSEEFNRFVKLINQSAYWQLPYNGPPRESGFDGCYYSLEANTADQYNFVGTGSCRDTDGFAKACEALVEFAGLQTKIKLVWNPLTDTGKAFIVEDVALPDVKPERIKRHPKKLPPN